MHMSNRVHVFTLRLLVGAPKANDPLQRAVRTPGVLLRCPLDGPNTNCEEVVVDTTGRCQVNGGFSLIFTSVG